jgi:hypothetical protein
MAFRTTLFSLCTTACILTLANGVAPAHAVNLVLNGDFESNGGQGFIDWTGTPHPQVRVTTLPHWVNNHDIPNGSWGFNVVSSLGWLQSQNYYYPNFWGATPGYQNGNGFTTSPNGGWFIAADGFDYRSPLEQVITGLNVGSTYTLYFEYAHAQEAAVDGNSFQHWQVTFGNEILTTPEVLLPQHQFRGWYTASKQFTATSTSQVLSFLAYGTNGVPPYLLLDGVSLTADPTPPGPSPVPGPVPFLGIAGSLLWSRKLRRRIQSSAGPVGVDSAPMAG